MRRPRWNWAKPCARRSLKAALKPLRPPPPQTPAEPDQATASGISSGACASLAVRNHFRGTALLRQPLFLVSIGYSACVGGAPANIASAVSRIPLSDAVLSQNGLGFPHFLGER
jgi:hypothetical protein